MKRREIFRWLKLKNFAIYFLQEVRCTQEKENWWTSEWGFSKFSDPEGRFVIADVKTEGKVLTLANIYVPNDDNPTFFKNVLNQLISFDCGEIDLGGDCKFWRSKKTK